MNKMEQSRSYDEDKNNQNLHNQMHSFPRNRHLSHYGCRANHIHDSPEYRRLRVISTPRVDLERRRRYLLELEEMAFKERMLLDLQRRRQGWMRDINPGTSMEIRGPFDSIHASALTQFLEDAEQDESETSAQLLPPRLLATLNVNPIILFEALDRDLGTNHEQGVEITQSDPMIQVPNQRPSTEVKTSHPEVKISHPAPLGSTCISENRGFDHLYGTSKNTRSPRRPLSKFKSAHSGGTLYQITRDLDKNLYVRKVNINEAKHEAGRVRTWQNNKKKEARKQTRQHRPIRTHQVFTGTSLSNNEDKCNSSAVYNHEEEAPKSRNALIENRGPANIRPSQDSLLYKSPLDKDSISHVICSDLQDRQKKMSLYRQKLKEKESRKKLFLERGPARLTPCSDLSEEDNKSDKQNKTWQKDDDATAIPNNLSMSTRGRSIEEPQGTRGGNIASKSHQEYETVACCRQAREKHSAHHEQVLVPEYHEFESTPYHLIQGPDGYLHTTVSSAPAFTEDICGEQKENKSSEPGLLRTLRNAKGDNKDQTPCESSPRKKPPKDSNGSNDSFHHGYFIPGKIYTGGSFGSVVKVSCKDMDSNFRAEDGSMSGNANTHGGEKNELFQRVARRDIDALPHLTAKTMLVSTNSKPKPGILLGGVEEASDSECEDVFQDSNHNLRPDAGEWIEPKGNQETLKVERLRANNY